MAHPRQAQRVGRGHAGAVAGLVAITPACGFVGPWALLAIGFAGSRLCFHGATDAKNKLGYDDSLDAFGVHGVGGTLGALLTGICAFFRLFGGSKPGLDTPASIPNAK